MRVATIAVDGLNEEEFRRSIENRLRWGKADSAVERLRELLVRHAGIGRTLPARFLTVTAADLTLTGWEALAGAIQRHDRSGYPVTALSIAFGWPGDDAPAPGADGRLAPHIETSYYNDEAFPFSQSGREDLLEGYSYHGCTWAGDAEATDSALAVSGIDDLHGALAALEARLLASDQPDEAGIEAGSLGACLLSVLLFQAVGARIERDGLPRALCVMAGSNGVYPYFDAPVVGISDDARAAAEAAHGIPAPRYSSLLLTGIPRARKRAVLVLEESEDELAARLAKLRGLNHGASEPAEDLPDPETAVTAAPGSPLMTKKPGGPAWDFRDMLTPEAPAGEPQGEAAHEFDADDDWPEPEDFEPVAREPAAPPVRIDDPEPTAPEPPAPPAFGQVDWSEPPPPTPPAEPAREFEPLPPARLLPRPEFDPEPEPAPGFTLLEPDLQERLQALLTAYEPPTARAPEPVVEESIAYWPSGPSWIEEDEPAPPSPLPARLAVRPAPHSLLARFRAWWRGAR